ncbi:MAG: Vi polysaccharide biosynthesis protein VipB/TviC [Candidatus Edwardsbacteria bacterium RIFOXYD12_FULL_50_11]|uniref:Vi polysaccharide biosynthesis protein VipB/TviC n=1 Tax=Candidatus Edwardsbacteria bacterium GWF2_54_11 TaxID=1817851 RepID=A0A1F5R2K0_9BACT|nr:MAG: Vi polysaccharide biosynthesis protein VipB/TviC [Candidatus Edwardsbacteria bacterium RifOxyC12_full_54_24]OGF07869.1 MAG: Vi polysaccharide biosynthesis protein VipB/TviC [Candidatus Edwardsbacteria bacterium RifOxyA12_full_54_48]OGF08141.1 MAG: Vi polysaccharide biosynthesis protein VipB/TviC [Candidatus Edwardsbacteria bacterium GWF2_54_11]OGF10118.1 MAG: Vi polysaccharide biosynthesis protein VipB/TviC [Candidatus Edwardsbacteria bacterium GWE2_54_12]OGF15029.1 MAG: Vi polysacchari
MSEKYLITGGAGFIGSNLTAELLNSGAQVRVLDNFSTGKRENLLPFKGHQNMELIEGDLRSFHIVRQAVKGVDYVLHQGALPSVPRSIADPITTNDVNILGTLNVLEAAKEFGVKRVVYASSSSIYGNSPTLPKSEEMPVQPLSPYALSKYTGERYSQIFHQVYGLETVCLRYFNVFGPNQDPASQYSAVIPKFIKMISEGISPIIYGDGGHSRDFTPVANVVRANLLACRSTGASGQVFNIACGQRHTLLDLVTAINKFLGSRVEPRFEKERAGDVRDSMASIERAAKGMGYRPEVSFQEGLASLIKITADGK